jgi:non-specific protein-tyrosine kinase
MKLQKALDKSRVKRKQKDTPSANSGARTTTAQTNEQEPMAPPIHPPAPVYHRSMAMQADPEVVKANRCICIEPDAPEGAAYKILRTRIQEQAASHDRRIVMVTSPTPGDGKTLTCVNLALTMARAYDQTVMVADCDLNRQDVHKTFGIDSPSGIYDHLADGTPMEDIIVWPGIDKLSFISGGRPVGNGAEVLGSLRMKSLVAEMKSRYPDRIVLLDTAPILGGADTLELAPLVDCIILVVAEGKTNMKDVFKALEMLPEDKLVGFVMNRQREETPHAYYY